MTLRRLAPWLAVAVGIVVAIVLFSGGEDEAPVESDDETAVVAPDDASELPSGGQAAQGKGGGSKKGGRSKQNGSPKNGEPAEGSGGPLPPGEDESPDPAGTVPPGASDAQNRAAVVLTIETYLGAIRQSYGRTACAQLTTAGQKGVVKKVSRIVPEVRGSGCEGAVIIYQGAYGDAINDPKIRNVTLTESTARAVGPLGEVATLSKLKNTWLIENYGN